MIGAAAICGGISLFFREQIIIIGTAFAGAYMLGTSFTFITSDIPPMLEIFEKIKAGNFNVSIYIIIVYLEDLCVFKWSFPLGLWWNCIPVPSL